MAAIIAIVITVLIATALVGSVGYIIWSEYKHDAEHRDALR